MHLTVPMASEGQIGEDLGDETKDGIRIETSAGLDETGHDQDSSDVFASSELGSILSKELQAWKKGDALYPQVVLLFTTEPDRAIAVSGELLLATCPTVKGKLQKVAADGIPAFQAINSLDTWLDLLRLSKSSLEPLQDYGLERIGATLRLASTCGNVIQVNMLLVMAMTHFFEDPEGVIEIVDVWGGDALKKILTRLRKWEAIVFSGEGISAADPEELLEQYTDGILKKLENKTKDRLKELGSLMSEIIIEPCTNKKCWWNDLKGQTHYSDKHPDRKDGVYRSAATVRWDQAIKLVQNYADSEVDVPNPGLALRECELESLRSDYCQMCKPELKMLFRLVRALAKERKLL